MLRGVNDSDEQARQLANLIHRHDLRAKVNLIPHNPADPLPYQPSPNETVERFKTILESKGIDTEEDLRTVTSMIEHIEGSS